MLSRTYTRPNIVGVFWYRNNVYGHNTMYPIIRVNRRYRNNFTQIMFLETVEDRWSRRINQKPLAEFKKRLVGI